ncbi:hypothetical protein C5167_040768 [Papaver somniferum]|uniref:Uncharacterized protein n=1 Tax=Papaver somniferum TaxID=3469 RepID=A0A4Y7IIB8_PAPSO|nr:hypothetical protein C5167_040768 [Papaver somniferum]
MGLRMESSRSGSNPSHSTTTPSQKYVSSKSKKPKFITVNFVGKVIGDWISIGKFATRDAELIRSHVPISHKEWRCVPDNFKDDVWTALKGEFGFNMDPASCWKIVEASFPLFYRRFKYEFRQTLKQRVFSRDKERKRARSKEGADIPEEVDEEPLPELTPEIWESARADVPLGIDPYI